MPLQLDSFRNALAALKAGAVQKQRRVKGTARR
jgi:hypothetical protein